MMTRGTPISMETPRVLGKWWYTIGFHWYWDYHWYNHLDSNSPKLFAHSFPIMFLSFLCDAPSFPYPIMSPGCLYYVPTISLSIPYYLPMIFLLVPYKFLYCVPNISRYFPIISVVSLVLLLLGCRMCLKMLIQLRKCGFWTNQLECGDRIWKHYSAGCGWIPNLGFVANNSRDVMAYRRNIWYLLGCVFV